MAACVAIGGWVTYPWILGRWTDPIGSATGAAYLAIALIFWSLRLRTGDGRVEWSPYWIGLAAVFAALFAYAYPIAPRLVSTELMLMALGFTLVGVLPPHERNRALSLVPLLMMTVPLWPSLEFYSAYPLRVCAAWIAAGVLGGGIRVEGTGLTDGVRTVYLDAPCSGMHMLLTGVALAACASLALRLSPVRSLMLYALAGVLAIVGNALRAASLFIVERAELGISHTPVGLLIFSGSVALLVSAAFLLDGPRVAVPRQPVRASSRTALRLSAMALCAASLAAFCAPFSVADGEAAQRQADAITHWPTEYLGERLIPRPFDAGMARFLKDFPGTMAEFQLEESGSVLLLRQCRSATRRLHPAERCYAATGWDCSSLPAMRDDAGHLWSRFRARRADGTVRTVRQCYFSVDAEDKSLSLDERIADAASWPDVSSWYWAASLPGSRVGTTIAVTLVE